jgi:hypothetical protein
MSNAPSPHERTSVRVNAIPIPPRYMPVLLGLLALDLGAAGGLLGPCGEVGPGRVERDVVRAGVRRGTGARKPVCTSSTFVGRRGCIRSSRRPEAQGVPVP